MKKIVHIIAGLGDGGAEGVLFRLARSTIEVFDITVISLTNMGKYGSDLEKTGVNVICLGLERGSVNIRAIQSMRGILKDVKPDIVQTWMHHADLLGGVVAYSLGVRSIFWNVRTAELHSRKMKTSTTLVIKACALLSTYIPKKIVSCSNRAIGVSLGVGYAKKFQLIPNGCDTEFFTQSDFYRKKIRLSWNVSDNCFVVGMVARYDPQKDHLNLITSLSVASETIRDIKLVLVGTGMDNSNEDLVQMIEDNGVSERVILLGQKNNIAEIMNGFDVHSLSSLYGEAFPNVLSEAMSCGVPCISTDVGDASEIIGDCGWVTEPGNSSQFSLAIVRAHKMKFESPLKWRNLQASCISRVKNNYELGVMVKNYLSLWKS